jgi:hypothetical protein
MERSSGAEREKEQTYGIAPRVVENIVLFGGKNGLVQALDVKSGDV